MEARNSRAAKLEKNWKGKKRGWLVVVLSGVAVYRSTKCLILGWLLNVAQLSAVAGRTG